MRPPATALATLVSDAGPEALPSLKRGTCTKPGPRGAWDENEQPAETEPDESQREGPDRPRGGQRMPTTPKRGSWVPCRDHGVHAGPQSVPPPTEGQCTQTDFSTPSVRLFRGAGSEQAECLKSSRHTELKKYVFLWPQSHPLFFERKISLGLGCS